MSNQNFFQAVGAILDVLLDEPTRPARPARPPRRTVVVTPPTQRVVYVPYTPAYPYVRACTFDHQKVEEARRCFRENGHVDHDDLIRCLASMSFDNSRSVLLGYVRRHVQEWSYFDRKNVAATFDFTPPHWLTK